MTEVKSESCWSLVEMPHIRKSSGFIKKSVYCYFRLEMYSVFLVKMNALINMKGMMRDLDIRQWHEMSLLVACLLCFIYQKALEEERYEDAAQLRDEAGAGLVSPVKCNVILKEYRVCPNGWIEHFHIYSLTLCSPYCHHREVIESQQKYFPFLYNFTTVRSSLNSYRVTY